MKKILAVLIFLLPWLVRAQVPQNVKGNGINVPYYDGTQLKAFFTGKNAKPIMGGNGEVLVSDFEMRTFRGSTNDVELIIRAAECFFNYTEKRAWSTNRLVVFSGTTNYFIEGQGFTCQQTRSNSWLVISNDVHTILQRETGTNSVGEKSGTKPKSTAPPLEIFSDHFEFLEKKNGTNQESRVATYTENVRVEDPEMHLTAGILIAQIPTGTNHVQNIVARTNVSILSKRDGGRATGDEAIYKSNRKGETVTLIGAPTWHDAQRQGRAEIFVFDRENRTVRAEGKAFMTVPRGVMIQPGLFSAPGDKKNQTTNGVIEISSEILTIKLPETNGPVQKLVAEKDVVIFSKADESRATGQKAVYDESSGLLELSGEPAWKVSENELRGNVLLLSRTNKAISARGNAYVKLPGRAFDGTLDGKTNATVMDTNKIVEIFSDDFDYKNNTASFRNNVKGHFPQPDSQAHLASGLLIIHFNSSNQVEQIVAERQVQFDQFSIPNTNANSTEKHLNCEHLTIDRWPATGWLKKIVASGNVRSEEINRRDAIINFRKMSGQMVEVQYSRNTNRVDEMIAEGNVVFEKDESTVRGNHVLYNLTNDEEFIRVSGNPFFENAKFALTDADVLIYNFKTGKYSGKPHVNVQPKQGFKNE